MAAKLPGILLMIAAVAAALSGEPATRTHQGVIAMAVCFILGVIMLADASAKSKKQKAAAPQQASASPAVSQKTPPAAPAAPPTASKQSKCPRCGKDVSDEFVACPHCGLELKVKCPNCGKWLDPAYVACPYCGTGLKQENK